MLSRFKKILISLAIIILLLALLLAGTGYVTVRRSFPQLSGEIQIAGLDAPVDIYRDSFGVPHIYAETEHDLFFAQGYVHAQDRFWQMDFWRHIGSGRLAEMFGESQIDTDRFLRALGWRRIAQQEWDMLDADSKKILENYAQGVNAYLSDHHGSEISLEYAILGLLNPAYTPEPWQPLHTLTWAKVMAWDLGGNMDSEVERAVLLKTLSPEQIAEIIPSYPADHPIILPDFRLSSQRNQAAWVTAYQAYRQPAIAHAIRNAQQGLRQLDDLLGPRGVEIGSNSWVISAQKTDTGMPLLANDPHLGIQMPSIWYEVGLHCRTRSPDCRLDVTGFSFAGAPGVIIGHNDRIAWGFTNVGPDVQDLYIEKINPANPNQYEVNGQWVDMSATPETIYVAGGAPLEITVRSTRHGPLIWDNPDDNQEMLQLWGVALPEQFAVALRWTALEPTNTFPAIWQMNLAQNWQDFRRAASLFDVPSQNLIYADVDGNIGYQTPGKIPIRSNGDGSLPVPGWTDEYEWIGYIPFEELPNAFNPEQGYIATANNAVIGAGYPYLISQEWDMGFRAQRIVQMIEGAPGTIDSAYIQKIQGDNKNLIAEEIIPLLLQLPMQGARLQAAQALLQGWDYQDHMDSAPSALFAVFWKQLMARTFQDDLPEDYWPVGGARWWEVIRKLVQQPDNPWWDDRATGDVRENRDQILLAALEAAVKELQEAQGKNPARWSWGDLHTATFRNATLGESGIAPIEALFNRGPFRTSGGSSIVNATGWSAAEPYAVGSVPSMRMIVDLGNLGNSLSIHTTGQSGHAYHPHYIDMADLWRTIQYHPMLWDLSQVQTSAAAHLRLNP